MLVPHYDIHNQTELGHAGIINTNTPDSGRS